MIAAILTLSDRCSTGERLDGSGPALKLWLEERGVTVATVEVIPDESELISERLTGWADSGRYQLILTTGGTGVSPRDVTPESTERILDRILPGFGEVMRMESLKKTPHAIISRAVAGIRKTTLIVNLPGSPKGATECLGFVWAAIPHAVDKIQGDPAECGS
ncbi:MogA/MoaB family molybdenum cofactor biosynthesis protein [Geomonas sp. Red32]|uniref:MogA/MoaB family molybdenum cofactor biosynthesis protein n=1 Tax=Geomonas sp. Red32 TaxID=2912856 RepID=UPI00202CBC65|nr:MogA/MoaB family molybdenum cofactor biosynthesis protein [Geomonas sp. Red32]MCM0083241.1 MogA/MoaB family molybdenum cofactor biosynthesis protein [Geomonas sp. Red32]